jgi:hypothetical protein
LTRALHPAPPVKSCRIAYQEALRRNGSLERGTERKFVSPESSDGRAEIASRGLAAPGSPLPYSVGTLKDDRTNQPKPTPGLEPGGLELAHGIHPAILSEAGLDAALRTLAEAARVPLEILGCSQERFPPATEAAAYAVAVEALDRTGEDGVALRAARHGDTLVVDAEGRDVAPTIHLVDRVGALGGTVAATPRGLRAEIPCA